MQWIKPDTKIDFVGKRTYFFLFSLALIALSGLSFLWPKPNWGIDFAGGTELRVRFVKPVKIGEIRSAVDGLGLGESQIQNLRPGIGEAPGHNDFIIRAEQQASQEGKETAAAGKLITDKLGEKFGEDAFQVLAIDYVGPKVGKELRMSAVKALVFAMIGILFYVSIRFEFRYALGAVLALFHDALISAGVYNVIQREWSLAIIAALLTIVGYSVNDTIVVFDRIRENVRKARRGSLREIVNQSINETLSRTILTNFATMLAVGFLAFFGSGVIRDFAIIMSFGMVVGTYSTIYIASSLVLLYEDVRNRGSAGAARTEKSRKPAPVSK